MTGASARVARTEEMRRRCGRFLSARFIGGRIAPLAGEDPGSEYSIEVVRLKGTRFTLRCAFPSGAAAYVKAYRGHLGPGLYATLRALWAAGFDGRGPYRVPEPLGFLADENVVVMREARGAALSGLLADSSAEAAEERVRAAARWLAALHTAAVPGLDQEGPCERSKILKESDMLAGAAAAQPGDAPALLEFLAYVHELGQACDVAPRLTPTHGQFTPSTVFIDGESVTAIDLDTVSVSDPAKDAATFVSKLRYRELFKTRGDKTRANRLAHVFLEEYARAAPGNLQNLQYYLALYCLKEVSKTMSPATPPEAAERAKSLCRAEMQRLLGDGAAAKTPPGARTEAERAAAETIAAWRALCSAAPREGPMQEARSAEVSVVQAKGTHRTTLRLRAPSGACLYAKWYPNNLGRRCWKVSTALAAAGFGEGSPFRVPEVAAVVPDRTVLIMSAAEGRPLETLFQQRDVQGTLAGCRRAARWLAALHSSEVRVGRPEREWTSLKAFRIPEKMIEACAAAPKQLTALLEILYQLKHRVERLPAARGPVQTHGSFRAKHIYLGEGVTTAIDLDRSAPADPAKDAAEFVSDVRARGFDGAYDSTLAETAAETFLEEYPRDRPELAARIGCYTASYLTLRLLKRVREAAAAPESFDRYCEAIGALCRKN